MPYGHLIAVFMMTLGVCQGNSLIASFLARDVIYTGSSHATLATARPSCFIY